MAKRSNDTSALAASVKEPQQKLPLDVPRKKKKKKDERLNGHALSLASLNSTEFGANPMLGSGPPCLPLGTADTPGASGGNVARLLPLGAPPQTGSIELQPLVNRAIDGDTEALAYLRSLLADCPELWQQYGDVGMLGLLRVIQQMTGGNEFSRESVWRYADSLWRELVGDQSTGLLRVCAQSVIMGALEMAFLTMTVPSPGQDLTIAQERQLLRRRDSAQRRFASAVKTFLLVRKHEPSVESLAAGSSQAAKGRPVNGHTVTADPLPSNGNGKHSHDNGTKHRRQVGTGAGNGAVPAIQQNRFSKLVLDEDDA